MKKYELVPPSKSEDTVACLERLLEEAHAGKLRGIAFAALLKGRHYVTHACGDVWRERVLTRGVLRELDDSLSRDKKKH